LVAELVENREHHPVPGREQASQRAKHHDNRPIAHPDQAKADARGETVRIQWSGLASASLRLLPPCGSSLALSSPPANPFNSTRVPEWSPTDHFDAHVLDFINGVSAHPSLLPNRP
jgi:hypothetical protein